MSIKDEWIGQWNSFWVTSARLLWQDSRRHLTLWSKDKYVLKEGGYVFVLKYLISEDYLQLICVEAMWDAAPVSIS